MSSTTACQGYLVTAHLERGDVRERLRSREFHVVVPPDHDAVCATQALHHLTNGTIVNHTYLCMCDECMQTIAAWPLTCCAPQRKCEKHCSLRTHPRSKSSSQQSQHPQSPHETHRLVGEGYEQREHESQIQRSPTHRVQRRDDLRVDRAHHVLERRRGGRLEQASQQRLRPRGLDHLQAALQGGVRENGKGRCADGHLSF